MQQNTKVATETRNVLEKKYPVRCQMFQSQGKKVQRE